MIVSRNILLAEKTGAHIHCQHMSAAGSIRLLREAKSAASRSPAGVSAPLHADRCDNCWQRNSGRDGKGVNYPGDVERPAAMSLIPISR